MRKPFSEKTIFSILNEREAGSTAKELSRRHAVVKMAIYRWQSKYDGMEVSEVKRFQ